jgi:predicted dehydrogenase
VLAPSGVEETLAGTLYFPAGRVAQINVSFHLPFRSSLELVGETGSLALNWPFHCDNPAATLILRQGDQSESITVAPAERYLLEIEDLHDAILEGREPLITAADTRGNIETILALLASARAKSSAAL